MAIARKVSPSIQPGKVLADEKKIEALIGKGGSSIQSKKTSATDEDDFYPVLVRFYKSHISEIEEYLEQLPKRHRLSRHAYIVQAVEEKILRDKNKKNERN